MGTEGNGGNDENVEENIPDANVGSTTGSSGATKDADVTITLNDSEEETNEREGFVGKPKGSTSTEKEGVLPPEPQPEINDDVQHEVLPQHQHMEMDDDTYNLKELHTKSKDEDGSKIRQEHPVWVMHNDLKDYMWFNKNDKVRVRVECKDGCPWSIYCAKLDGEDTWQIRTMNDEHSYRRDYRVRMMKSKGLSKRLVNGVRENPNIKGSDLRERVHKFNCGVSKTTALRARAHTKTLIHGNLEELENNNSDVSLAFHRLYICLKMLLVAYAVVEGENTNSWKWFMELLIKDLGAREKPIVSMLENIHIYLMERWDTNSKKVVAWEGSVLANIKKRLMLESRNTNNWLPRMARDHLFEVILITQLEDKFTMNLQTQE
ncbi:hypothetical protein JHK86_033711 [Glycine max]|nr:hypothetical protein JHK86_033711 [Glycine max]